MTGDPRESERIVSFINARQYHRGPDHNVAVSVGPFCIGNTRLAIQDISPSGNQPFVSSGGRYVCVFNGEIYNAPELVQAHGLPTAPNRDGAVIPELWERYGRTCVRMLRGMFAAAVVDKVENKLYLFRDPFGIKPLFLRRLEGGGLAFASEARVLASVADPRSIDLHTIASFLHLGAPWMGQSAFQGIHGIPANTMAILDQSGDMAMETILDPDFFIRDHKGRSLSDLVDAFVESVRIHLRADVPIALPLSSGVDSGAIACVARRLGRTLDCITIGTVGVTDESKDAADTAAAYGHRHRIVPAAIDPETLSSYFGAMQHPSLEGLQTYLVSRAIAEEGFKVALSGTGGDEALGGYAQFRRLALFRLFAALARAPAPARRAARAAGGLFLSDTRKSYVDQILSLPSMDAWQWDVLHRRVFFPDDISRLTGVSDGDLGLQARQSEHRGSGLVNDLIAAEVELFLRRILSTTDSFSMAHSLEMRVPFVDAEFFPVGTIAATSARLARGKKLFAQALGDPHLIAAERRPKRFFGVGIGGWLESGHLKPHADDLRDPAAPVWDYIDRSAAEPFLVGAPWIHRWAFVVLNLWLQSVASDRPMEPALQR